MYSSCNHSCNPCGRNGGFFSNYQTFWIIVVFAIVVIWVNYETGVWGGNGCGCGCCNESQECGCGC